MAPFFRFLFKKPGKLRQALDLDIINWTQLDFAGLGMHIGWKIESLESHQLHQLAVLIFLSLVLWGENNLVGWRRWSDILVG